MGLPYDKLLKPVSVETPSGIDLRRDPTYMKLMRLAPGTPGRQEILTPPTSSSPAVTHTIPAQDPDWPLVRDLCIELCDRTHDLHVLAWYTVAQLKLEGYPGLVEGLGALRWVLERHWDTIHPQLDPSDPEDEPARLRTKALNQLTAPPSPRDELKLISRLRDAVLARSDTSGQVTLRQIAVAAGEEAPADPAAARPEMAKLQSVFIEADPTGLVAARNDVTAALGHLGAIHRVFAGSREHNEPGRVKPGQEPNFDRLRQTLTVGLRHIDAALTTKAPTVPGPDGSAFPAAAPAKQNGVISSRSDAGKVLEGVVKYFMENERSSPVWLFAQAARQLIDRRVDELFQVLDQSFVEKVKKLGEEKTNAPR